jgi:hypothetical protein
MNGYELRWLIRQGWDGPEKVLQFRSKQDTTVWAGMPTQEQIRAGANYQWSKWIDVPEVKDAN